MQSTYDLVNRNPVARFYYKGNHSHPVRRTVLIVQSTPGYIKGYELREGSITRTMQNAPVKTFRKDRIATLKDLGAAKHREPGPKVSTLVRNPLIDFVVAGA
jgi:hypothetical protein